MVTTGCLVRALPVGLFWLLQGGVPRVFMYNDSLTNYIDKDPYMAMFDACFRQFVQKGLGHAYFINT